MENNISQEAVNVRFAQPYCTVYYLFYVSQ
jgi:hypothetical protein